MKFAWLSFSILIILGSSGDAFARRSAAEGENIVDKPYPTRQSEASGSCFIGTIYHLIDSSEFGCKDKDKRKLTFSEGRSQRSVLACPQFIRSLYMEGSGTLRLDGQSRVVNVDERGAHLIAENICPFGVGRAERCLVPYVSIAASAGYGAGTVLHVPNLVGMEVTLPSGARWIHDGYVIVSDSGALVQGMVHFDFYSGPNQKPLLSKGLGDPKHCAGNFTNISKVNPEQAKEIKARYEMLFAHGSRAEFNNFFPIQYTQSSNSPLAGPTVLSGR